MSEIKPIITSLIDNDLYKLTQMQAVSKKFPYARVSYEFINRGKTEFPENFGEELRKQVKHMETLRLTNEEKEFLKSKCYYLDPVFIDLFSSYRYNSSEVGIIQKGGELQISIEGWWFRTILWEVPLMALISELYFKMTNQTIDERIDREENNKGKANVFFHNSLHHADFGTRRRYSLENQIEVVKDLIEYKLHNELFVGTSNMYIAFLFNLTPIGTHAHEWFMFHAAKYGYTMANHLAMENWTDVYRGDLGIALSDTFTTEVFFKSFDKKFAKLYDGVRQDSGDPRIFADKTIAHYKQLGIDPLTKTIVFSDNLNPNSAVELKDYCRGKIKCSFGIGTNLSNDIGVKPLNMVIKLISAKPEGEEWQDCIKLSDSPGKYTGNPEEIKIAKQILKIK